jgi:hypothetical protein
MEKVLFVTLEKNHIDFLKQILSKKLNVLWIAGLLYIAITTAYNLPSIISKRGSRWIENSSDGLEDFNYLILVHLFFELIIITALVYSYFKHIRPLQKDIKQKAGIIVKKQIIRKTYFEHTKKYYFFFQDLKIPNKEVSEKDFNSYLESDYYPFLIGTHSGIQLDEFANFTFL